MTGLYRYADVGVKRWHKEKLDPKMKKISLDTRVNEWWRKREPGRNGLTLKCSKKSQVFLYESTDTMGVGGSFLSVFYHEPVASEETYPVLKFWTDWKTKPRRVHGIKVHTYLLTGHHREVRNTNLISCKILRLGRHVHAVLKFIEIDFSLESMRNCAIQI